MYDKGVFDWGVSKALVGVGAGAGVGVYLFLKNAVLGLKLG